MGFALAASDPWLVGDPFICHQQIPLETWGHFLPGKKYSPALSNHQIGNLRDSHKQPQPKASRQDHWDPATSFWAHPGMPEMWLFLGTLDGLGGLTKVMIYPAYANSLQRIVVLKHSDTGSDSHRVTSYLTNLQRTKAHQLKVPKITLSTYSWTNKEHFPVWL